MVSRSGPTSNVVVRIALRRRPRSARIARPFPNRRPWLSWASVWQVWRQRAVGPCSPRGEFAQRRLRAPFLFGAPVSDKESLLQPHVRPPTRQGSLHHPPRERRREEFDEGIDVAPQEGVAPYADACRRRFEEVGGVEDTQVFVRDGVDGHAGQYSHAEPHGYVGLDDVRVNGGEYDVGLEAAAEEGLVDLIAAGEGEVVGDDGPAGDLFQGQGIGPKDGTATGSNKGADHIVRPLFVAAVLRH